MINKALLCLLCVFLFWFGWRSLVAGIKNENKKIRMYLGFNGFQKLYKEKEKYDRVVNIILGGICIVTALALVYKSITNTAF